MSIPFRSGINLILAISGAPTSGTWSLGDIVQDNTGELWRCSVAGTPGTWVKQGIGSCDLLSPLLSSEVSITAATTLTSTAFGKMHVISGTSADYTINLPTAVGNAGKPIGLRVAPFASADKIYTLDGNSTETINGALRLALIHSNVVILVSDGTNWNVFAAKLDSPMVDTGVLQIDGTGSGPTIGTNTINRVLLRRIGPVARLRYEVRQTVAGAGGSGEYLYRLPLGLSFASNVNLYTGAGPGGALDYAVHGRAICGMVNDGTSALMAFVAPYDATRFRLMGLTWNSGGAYVQGSAAVSWGGAANMALGLEFDAPIADW